MPGSYTRLERFGLICRWAFGLILILGGCGAAFGMGSYFARHHAWPELSAIGLTGLASVLLGLSYVWKPRLAFPATYVFFAGALWLFAYTLNDYMRNKALAEALGFDHPVFASGLVVLLAGCFIYLLHRAAAKGEDALLGYLGWPNRKPK
ncbi:MAG: hypothetical protein ACLP1Y_01555 [Candidatus Acidiferrales bacterium]